MPTGRSSTRPSSAQRPEPTCGSTPQRQPVLDDAEQLGAGALAQLDRARGRPAVGLDDERRVAPGRRRAAARSAAAARSRSRPPRRPASSAGSSRSTKPKPRTWGRKTPVGAAGRPGRGPVGGEPCAGEGGSRGRSSPHHPTGARWAHRTTCDGSVRIRRTGPFGSTSPEWPRKRPRHRQDLQVTTESLLASVPVQRSGELPPGVADALAGVDEGGLVRLVTELVQQPTTTGSARGERGPARAGGADARHRHGHRPVVDRPAEHDRRPGLPRHGGAARRGLGARRGVGRLLGTDRGPQRPRRRGPGRVDPTSGPSTPGPAPFGTAASTAAARAT